MSSKRSSEKRGGDSSSTGSPAALRALAMVAAAADEELADKVVPVRATPKRGEKAATEEAESTKSVSESRMVFRGCQKEEIK